MHTIIEKEIKVLDIKKKKLIKQLEALGAERIFDGNVEDVYYDTVNDDLAQQDKRLRIREKNGTHYITLKENLHASKIKACYEHEQRVEDPQKIEELFTQYNLVPRWKKAKHRIAYRYKNVHFDIDLYDDIPPLLEIEATSKKKIYKWIKKLGLKKKTLATFGAQGLFKYYGMQEKLIRLS